MCTLLFEVYCYLDPPHIFWRANEYFQVSSIPQQAAEFQNTFPLNVGDLQV